jgi:conjugal transfer pilus assembly protein TraF
MKRFFSPTTLRAITSATAIVMTLLAAGIACTAHAFDDAPEAPISWYNQSIWDNPNRDYKWYPPEPTEQKPAPNPPPKPVEQKPKAFKDLKTVEEVSAELTRLQNKAVMSKKPADVLDFLKFQTAMMDSSSEFGDVLRRVVWANPEVDYSQRSPSNEKAILKKAERRLAIERQTVAELSKEHALFFFFKGSCPYCHQVGPVLRDFSEKTGIQILPISLDGGSLPDFENPKVDQVLSQEFGVKAVPAIYLVSKNTSQVQAISFGVIAQNDLLERIYVLTQTKPGETF